MKLAYTVREAAVAAGVSQTLIRRALHTTDPASFPPPLAAKQLGAAKNSGRLITDDELRRWVASFPDA